VIVDTSALIAIANDEPGRAVFVEMIFNADRVAISAPSLVEASIVLYRLAGGEALTKLSQFLNEANVERGSRAVLLRIKPGKQLQHIGLMERDRAPNRH
jgi:uncharacterized protein with PIN domain